MTGATAAATTAIAATVAETGTTAAAADSQPQLEEGKAPEATEGDLLFILSRIESVLRQLQVKRLEIKRLIVKKRCDAQGRLWVIHATPSNPLHLAHFVAAFTTREKAERSHVPYSYDADGDVVWSYSVFEEFASNIAEPLKMFLDTVPDHYPYRGA